MLVLDNSPSVTDWIAAGSGLATFLVALIALVFAAGQINESKIARRQVDEIERKKAEPSVVAYMEKAPSPYIIELVVKNFGPTPAYDVVVTSDTPIQRTGDNDRSVAEDVEIPDVIPFLAPGQEWRTIWDVAHTRSDHENLPDRHEVTVEFKGIDNVALSSRSVLDWGSLKSTRFMTTLGVHDLAKATKEMARTLKRATDIHGGLNIWVRSGEAKDQRQREWARKIDALNEQEKEDLKESFRDTSEDETGELQAKPIDE